jgi:hypothetical protein
MDDSGSVFINDFAKLTERVAGVISIMNYFGISVNINNYTFG